MNNTIAFSNLKLGGLPALGAQIGQKSKQHIFRTKQMLKSVKLCQSGGLVMEFLAFRAQSMRGRPPH